MSESTPDAPFIISQEAIESVREYSIFLVDTQGNVASWNEGAARV